MRTSRSRGSRLARLPLAIVALIVLLVGCGDPAPEWQIVGRHLPAGLLSVWGTSASDVYVVGADTGDGRGPLVMHFDGASWTRLETGQVGNLWWVHGFAGGPVYMAGDGGMILRYEQGTFSVMPTPGTATVFGIWGADPDELWAVGGALGGGSGAFAWRLQNDSWVEAPGFPATLSATASLWKVFGRSRADVRLVGTDGTALHWDGTTLAQVSTGNNESLFTVHGDAGRFVAVGGFGTGVILESEAGTWRDASPAGSPSLVGVNLSDGEAYAVGQEGAVYRRTAAGWRPEELGFNVDETLHSVWIDPVGGVWAVGGQVLTLPVIDGIMLYLGSNAVRSL